MGINVFYGTEAIKNTDAPFNLTAVMHYPDTYNNIKSNLYVCIYR